MVATKAALSIRVDALSDPDGKSEADASAIGVAHRVKLESRLRALEYQGDASGVRRFADSGKKQQSKFEMTGETKTYNTKADAVDLVSTQRADPMEIAVQAVLDVKEERRRAKEERRAKRRAEKEKGGADDGEASDAAMDVDGEKKDKKDKKDKKRKRRESDVANGDAEQETQEKVQLFYRRMLSFMPNQCCRRRPKRSGRPGKRRARPRRQRLPSQMVILQRSQKRRSGSQRRNLLILFNHFLVYILHRCFPETYSCEVPNSRVN